MFIHDLYNVIQRTVKGYNVEIIYGNGYLEVKPTGIKKTKLVDLLLQKITKTSKIDWIFYLGNDSEDEAVFEFLKSDKKCKQYFQQDCQKYICVLEKKPSEADFYIEERDTVRPLLQKFQNATQYRKKNRSYADLNALTSDIRPLGGDKKMKTKNKLQQIASYGNLNLSGDLSMYMKSNIDHSLVLSSTGKPFIPRNQGSLKPYQNLSAKQIIEKIDEESAEDRSARDLEEQPGNLPLAQSKRKFLSLDDTKNPHMLNKKADIELASGNAEDKLLPDPKHNVTNAKED